MKTFLIKSFDAGSKLNEISSFVVVDPETSAVQLSVVASLTMAVAPCPAVMVPPKRPVPVNVTLLALM